MSTADELDVYQGTSLHAIFEVFDASGDPFIMTGYTGRLQIRPRPGGELLVDATPENGRLTVAPEGFPNEVHLDLGADITEGITRAGAFDCLIWNPAVPDEVFLAAHGTVALTKAVTILA